MFKLYACLGALLLLCTISFAQTISIPLSSNEFRQEVCLNATYQLPIVTTGNFGTDNKFSVQIKKYDASNILAEIPVTLTSGKLEFRFTDSLKYGNSAIQIRVISSSPRVLSEWSQYGVAVYTKGSIIINPGNKTDTLNTFDQVEVPFRVNSFRETRVTLNDSTKVSFYANEAFYDQTRIIAVSPAGTFTIAHAENYCGAMKVSGKHTIVLNAPMVKTMMVNPSSICENSEVTVRLSASGAGFTSATKYRVRFRNHSNNGETPATLEVPATPDGDFLRATFPATANINQVASYYVQVVTENPSTVSTPFSSPIQVWSAPSATFNTASQTINYAENFGLNVNLKGMPPYSVEFTNGRVVNSYESQANLYVYPTQDESYSIKSFTTGCGKIDVKDPQVVQVKVRQGMRFDEPAERRIVCGTNNVRFKIATNATITAATTFSIQLHDFYSGETSTVPANKNGDYVEFNLPPREKGYGGFGYQVTATNPVMQTAVSYHLLVQTMPDLVYNGYNNSFVVEKPQTLSAYFTMTGGSPYKVEYFDGTIAEYNADGNFASKEFFLKDLTEFKIKSISNSCFSNTNPRSATFRVSSPASPAIYLAPITTGICNSDSLEVAFEAVGTFNAGNKFSIQGYGNCCEFTTLHTVDGSGKYKVRLKSDYWFASNGGIRIASSNPVVFSDVRNTNIQFPVSNVTIYPETTAENPSIFLSTEGRVLSVRPQTGNITSLQYTLNNGPLQTETVTYDGNSGIDIPIKAPVGQMSEYQIKSVSNACGTVPITASAYVTPTAYHISFASYNSDFRFCHGDPFSVSFGITNGNQSPNATFDLVLTKQGGTDKTTIISGATGSTLKGIIPSTLSAGFYYMSIVSSEGPVTYPVGIQVSEPATATLTSLTGADHISVEAGQGTNLKLQLTGSSPWTTYWDAKDNSIRNHYYNSEDVHFNPSRSQEFAVKAVTNACGYGKTSGSVKITVSPRLQMYSNTSLVCTGTEFRMAYNLAGDADLADGYITFSLVDANDRSEIKLDSTKNLSGEITLKIPANLTGTSYQIKGQVAKYSISSFYTVQLTPRAQLTISGNNTINNGTSTQLVLTSTRYSGYTDFVLSDGTSGNVFVAPGQYNYVRVSPAKTTTYTIASVKNACGPGEAAGSATVEVNQALARGVTVSSWQSLTSNGFCTNDTILVTYATSGTFSATNVMTVQVSDSTGRNFQSIKTLGNINPLRAVLPANLPAGGQYRLRVIASDAGSASGAFEYSISAGQRAKARFESESVIYDGKTNPKVVVLLEGGSPWSYQFGTDNAIQNRHTAVARDEVVLYQASPSQYYRLFSVSNSCGVGIVEAPSTVKVEIVTGIEPQLQFNVTVAPNPGQDVVRVDFHDTSKKLVRVLNMNGKEFRHFTTYQTMEMLDISDLAAGAYLLVVEAEGKSGTFKMVKSR